MAGAEQDSRLFHDGSMAVVRRRQAGRWAPRFDGVLVTDQYAGYRFIDADQRQLCWAPSRPAIRRPSPRVASSATSPSAPGYLAGGCGVSVPGNRWGKRRVEQAEIPAQASRVTGKLAKPAGARGVLLRSKRYRGRCQLLLRDDRDAVAVYD